MPHTEQQPTIEPTPVSIPGLSRGARLASVGILSASAVLAPAFAAPLADSAPQHARASAAEHNFDELINNPRDTRELTHQISPTDINLAHQPTIKDSVGLIAPTKFGRHTEGSPEPGVSAVADKSHTQPLKPAHGNGGHNKRPARPAAQDSNERPVEIPMPILPVIPEQTEANPQPQLKLELKNLAIPEEAQRIIDQDTTFLFGNGCSGSLVRNPAGEPIGTVTAEHCGFRGTNDYYGATRTIGTDGKTYIVKSGLEARTGKQVNNLTPQGKITEILAANASDMTHDFALGAFAGHTMDEVLAAYNATKLSEAEINGLKLGDTMYLSGWPALQPENMPGENERQDFALRILGKDTVTMTSGEVLDVVWAVVPKSVDGAICSFGNSGGVGFVVIDGIKRPVGDLAAFYPFSGNSWGTPESQVAARLAYEGKFNVDLSDADAICGFTSEIPDGDARQLLQVVDKKTDIPGFEQSDSDGDLGKGGDIGSGNGSEHVVDPLLYANALANFLDPTAQHLILRGVMEINNGSGKDGEPSFIKDPVLYYENGDVVLGWSETNSPEGFTRAYAGTINNLLIHTTIDEPTISTYFSTGEVQVIGGAYVDAQQQRFGEMLTSDPMITDTLIGSIDAKTGAVTISSVFQGK